MELESIDVDMEKEKNGREGSFVYEGSWTFSLLLVTSLLEAATPRLFWANAMAASPVCGEEERQTCSVNRRLR